MRNAYKALGCTTAALALFALGVSFNVNSQEVSNPEHMQAIAEVVLSLCQESEKTLAFLS